MKIFHISIKGILSYFICLCLLYGIVNPLRFHAFPFVTTRMACGFLGFIYLIKSDYWRMLNVKGMSIIGSFIAIVFMSFFTDLLNGTRETFFITYPLSMLIVFAACCFWLNVVKKIYGEVSQELISHFLVMTSLMMILTAVIYFLFPNVEAFLMSLLTDDFIPITEGTDLSFRLNGFGCFGSGCGVIFSVVLAVCAYNIIKKEFRDCQFYVVSMILIVAIGSLMARTTIVGASFVFLFMMIKSLGNYKIVIRNTFIVVTFSFIAVEIISSITFSDELMEQFSYGFEMFFNLADNGHLETNSTNSLSESLEKWPSSIFTWLFGDGLYFMANDENYMSVDNAYQRMIFYFGIIGMFLMFRYNYYMYKVTALSMNDKTLPLLFLMLYFIIGIKGELLFLSTYFGLYMFYPVVNKLPNEEIIFRA